MVNLIKKTFKYSLVSILAILITILNFEKIEISGKIYNQGKFLELRQFLDNKSTSLILQTVTGDKRYRNEELIGLYKNLQIIHILIISGGNIVIILKFIHIFIYRKSMISLILSIIFIYSYGKIISFPETLVRAIQTTFLTKLVECFGVKFSTLRSSLITAFTFVFTFFIFNLGDSYKLSAIYSLVILFNSEVVKKKLRNNFLIFIISNTILTATSSYVFRFDKFSVTCTSFFANILINLLYDYAIYLAYVLYILPTKHMNWVIKDSINEAFSLLFQTLNFTKVLTYNICNE